MNEVIVNEVVSTVRAVDSDTLLTPRTLNTIVRLVLAAVEEKKEHEARVRAEQRISGGVREELSEGWG